MGPSGVEGGGGGGGGGGGTGEGTGGPPAGSPPPPPPAHPPSRRAQKRGLQDGRSPDAQQRRSRDLVREVCFLGGELETLWPMAGGGGRDVGTQHQVRRNLQTRGVVFGNHLPQSSSFSRIRSTNQGQGRRSWRPSCMPAWRRLPGASFKNLVLSKFHISTASSVSAHSRLWSPVKL
jgi:hypothetical protein